MASQGELLNVVPSRWQDPSSNRDKSLKQLRVLLGRRGKLTQQDIDSVKKGLMKGDPKADAVVDWMMSLPSGQGRKIFEQALNEGIASIENPDQRLVDLFKEIDDVPTWLDSNLIDTACAASHRVGMAGQVVLSCVCLMGGYRSSAANKPIAKTGALGKYANRRLAETSKFVIDLYESGGLNRYGDGFKGAVKVRLMHALVRHRLMNDPTWKFEEWGVPINQADMLATNLLFSVTSSISLQTMGFIFNKKERQAVIHFWRYVGNLMGIDDALLPKTYREGMKLIYISGASQPGGDQDTRELANALRDLPMENKQGVAKALGYLEMQLRSGFSRLILGNYAAKELDLPNNVAKYALFLVAPGVFVSECLRVLIPGATGVSVKLGRRIILRHVNKILAGHKPNYQPYPVN